MQKESVLKHGRHSVFLLHVHLVFVTKYRRQIFDNAAIASLQTIFSEVCTALSVDLLEMDGEREHVHLLLNYPPRVAISNLVKRLKGISSNRLRKERPDIARRYFKDVLWSPSYFAASCGGAPLQVLRKYIENQKRPL